MRRRLILRFGLFRVEEKTGGQIGGNQGARSGIRKPARRACLTFAVLIRKISRIVNGVLLASVGYLVWQGRPLDIEREFGPSPTLPSPNGWDEALRASALLGTIQFTITRFHGVDPSLAPGAQMASPNLEAAKRCAYWLAGAQSGFRTLDHALKMPFQVPIFRATTTTSDKRVEAYRLRDVARFKSLQALTLGEQNDHFGAASAAVDAIELGAKMHNGGGVVDSLQASACEGIGRAASTKHIAFLDATEAATLATRLRRINAGRAAWPQIMANEKLQGAFSIRNGLKEAIREAIDHPGSQPDGPSPWVARLEMPLTDLEARSRIVEVNAAIDNALPNAQVPWPNYRISTSTNGDFTSIVLAGLEASRFFHERTVTTANQLQIRLALHAFRKERGAYPRSLAELDPAFGATTALDTFAGVPMRYQLVGTRYKLWSVGPDARDDGGKPIEDPTKTEPKARFLTRATSKGDIVANINS